MYSIPTQSTAREQFKYRLALSRGLLEWQFCQRTQRKRAGVRTVFGFLDVKHEKEASFQAGLASNFLWIVISVVVVLSCLDEEKTAPANLAQYEDRYSL